MARNKRGSRRQNRQVGQSPTNKDDASNKAAKPSENNQAGHNPDSQIGIASVLPSTPKIKEKAQSAEKDKTRPLDRFVAIFTIVGAIATVVAAVFAYGQWSGAYYFGRIQLGAQIVVTIDPNNFDKPIDIENIPVRHFGVKNTGLTPAYEVKNSWNIGIGVYPMPEDFDFSKSEYGDYGSVTVFPGTLEKIGINADFRQKFTPNQFNMIKAGFQRLYVWGVVNYKDVFGANHFTHFCFSYFISREPDRAFEICSRYNDAS